jgi:heme-degrading monooxygenase HmoA
MAVTLINTFIVPEEQEAEFLKNWKKTTEVYSRTSGFIETHLHRNTGVGDGTFKFINIARWESAEAWRSTHEDYTPGENSLPGVEKHPAIYESIIEVRHQGEK